MKTITILGSTGSIGLSTLNVVNRHVDQYRVFALTANSQVDRLYDQCLQHKPRYAVMADANAAEQLSERLQSAANDTQVLSGIEGLKEVAAHPDCDYVMAAIVGAAGLLPTLAAVQAGKRVLLANKEALVMSGQLFMDEVAKHGAELLPIDSEHNAVFQCMPDRFNGELAVNGVRKVLLTASGGPFRTTPISELATVTPAQAVAHPNWEMGKKISVDSATMMNKGLEVIEACWLFNANPDQVQVVMHPQSVIHSMVEYADGSILAQLGRPDMRTPIAHALAWPARINSGVESLDLFAVAQLNFEAPDLQRFPCLRLAYEAIKTGGTMSAILNAANEVAVDAFLSGTIAFTNIPRVIETVMQQLEHHPADSLDVILADDAAARSMALNVISGLNPAAPQQVGC
ncbi:MAG: 1-deoxy-D-xylulose-5-phosphate reductoisomerase [Gammaproteobacteria bacterium]|nr:1-deoxy-D-xylulose-5-phosphate reductoisomerase [Gammaproteobacteria bacterium]MDH5652823.1 1-deoxy-D-xylulose-5-phosphate reductoisomerase [Gammaproteobacteria bacterium]